MDYFSSKEFYVNIIVTILLSLAAIFSNFNLDLTIIMGVAWTFFIIIHSIKLSAALKDNNIKLKNIQNTNIIGK